MESIELFAVEIYGDGCFYPGDVVYGDVYLKTNEELTAGQRNSHRVLWGSKGFMVRGGEKEATWNA